MLAWGKIDNLQIILFSRDLSYYCPIKKIAPKITDLLPRRTLNSFISNVAVLFQHSFPDGPSVVVVQLLSHIRLYNPMDCSKLVSIELVMLSNHLILCYPPLLLSSIFPSFRVFCNGSALCIRWSKYWSFSFSINPSNEHSGLISFRMDWLGLLAVQGTLKSLLQHHSLKTSILQRSAFFIVQLSHPYMTTGKTIALTRQTFVSKVMSLLFHMLSRLVHTVKGFGTVKNLK